MNGKGKFIYAENGNSYDGEWKEGVINGKGKYIFASGS